MREARGGAGRAKIEARGLGGGCQRAAALLGCLVLLAAAGCKGGSSSSPTAPTAGPAAQLSTAYGALWIDTNGHAVDTGEMLASIERGYEKARGQIGSTADGMRLDGYRIVVMPADWELNGEHVRSAREIRMRAGVERVLAHELQHFFAWELGRDAQCRGYQDHPGGYDLLCRQIPG